MNGIFFPYVLSDANGIPFFVSVGKDGDWDAIWLNRAKRRDSELTQRLRAMDKPPTAKLIIKFPMTSEAAWLEAEVERKRLEAAGIVLADTRAKDRPTDTYVTGGGSNRPVVAPDGTIFKGVRDAARALNLTPTAITFRCQNKLDGWHYKDGNEKPKTYCALCGVQSTRSLKFVKGWNLAGGKICQLCNRAVIWRERRGELTPTTLRQIAFNLVANASTERNCERIESSTKPGLPIWLKCVADLVEAAELLEL